MKKKEIILSLIGILFVSVGLIIIINQNTKKVIMQDGTMLALTLDGSIITEFPSSTNYRVEIECENGKGKVIPEDGTWKFSVDNIEENIKCNIDFYSRTENDKLINTVQSASEIINEGNAGYRYEGTNPNNYIWFNNEMWRIIGLIPTKVDASGTTTNLVKIIRNESLGGIAYDAKASGYTGVWGSNTLYTLLNSYYYGKKNGTNTDYCYGSGATAKMKCDYRIKGISDASTDYYGRMVKNVYWNTGASVYQVTSSEAYTNEKAIQTVQGRVGLMNASDFGFAASSANHNSTYLNEYNTADITLSNWLYSQTWWFWTNTQDTWDADHTLAVNGYGTVVRTSASAGWAVRPVLYLDENVYTISGSGTELDPYIIGM